MNTEFDSSSTKIVRSTSQETLDKTQSSTESGTWSALPIAVGAIALFGLAYAQYKYQVFNIAASFTVSVISAHPLIAAGVAVFLAVAGIGYLIYCSMQEPPVATAANNSNDSQTKPSEEPFDASQNTRDTTAASQSSSSTAPLSPASSTSNTSSSSPSSPASSSSNEAANKKKPQDPDLENVIIKTKATEPDNSKRIKALKEGCNSKTSEEVVSIVLGSSNKKLEEYTKAEEFLRNADSIILPVPINGPLSFTMSPKQMEQAIVNQCKMFAANGILKKGDVKVADNRIVRDGPTEKGDTAYLQPLWINEYLTQGLERQNCNNIVLPRYILVIDRDATDLEFEVQCNIDHTPILYALKNAKIVQESVDTTRLQPVTSGSDKTTIVKGLTPLISKLNYSPHMEDIFIDHTTQPSTYYITSVAGSEFDNPPEASYTPNNTAQETQTEKTSTKEELKKKFEAAHAAPAPQTNALYNTLGHYLRMRFNALWGSTLDYCDSNPVMTLKVKLEDITS